jgi:prepilin-type processing-associated H-X9-DG protein
VKRFTLVHLLVIIALLALAGAMGFPALARARAAANLLLCKDHLRAVGVELNQYAQLTGGALPLSPSIDGPQTELLHDLSGVHCVGDPQNYYCPALHEQNRAFSDANFSSGMIGYYYYGSVGPGANKELSKFVRSGISWPRRLDLSMPKNTWLMSDIWVSAVPTAHAGYRKGLNYLMLDGSVGFISESPRQAFH